MVIDDDVPFLSTVTRRGLLGLTAAAAGAMALPSARAQAAQPVRAATPPPERQILDWIDRHATPVRQTDPRGPLDDLVPLRRVVRDAAIVRLGESAHGTHTEFALKHRIARYVVEELGFRTIAWEESWGSGVVLDRYVTGDGTDAWSAVGQALFMLRSRAMLDLVRWMREFDRGRPDWDQVRFLGADLHDLVRGLTGTRRRSAVDPDDAVQHAHAMLGFYESGSQAGGGDDLRDRYVADIVSAWRERTAHRIVYSAAKAHTTAAGRMIIEWPPAVRRRLDGPAIMRIMSAAYHPENDEHYAQHLASWRAGFDAILHVDTVAATELA